MALDPAPLHTSLADMPSQALFTRVCALLGTSEENGERAAVDDVMCALNNGPRLCFFFCFFSPLAVVFMFALNQRHVQDVFGVFSVKPLESSAAA